jgi:glycosyltransferase involved in cell wall biosynthesis
MRILVLNYEYPPLGGGSSPITASLCKKLAAEGVDVDVVTMSFRGLPRLEEDGRLTIHRVRCLRSRQHISYFHELLTYVISASLKALELAKKNQYDLIHTHFVVPGGAVAYFLHARLGIPYVITVHGSDVPGYNPDRFRWIHRVLGPAWRRILSRASAVTSPSQILASLVRKATKEPVPIEVIPNAIDPQWNEPGLKSSRILVVSRLFERKGVQYLLQALGTLQTGCEIHIVGDGPLRPHLENLAAQVPDKVVFHRWLKNDSPDLKKLYREALIFVFTSEAENFPVCLLEAMVSGSAILASNIPGCKEVLGDTAVWVPPRNSEAIREALKNMTGDRAGTHALGRASRRRAVEKFSWAIVAKQYLDVFSGLLPATGHLEEAGKPESVESAQGNSD